MESFTLNAKVEVLGMTDVLIIGAGPAGLCAAIAAARSGVRALLIEQNACSGGMATAGLVGPFMTCYDKSGERMIIRGLFEEIVDRLVAKGGALHPSGIPSGSAFTSWIGPGHSHVTPFEPEVLKTVADGMLRESGVRVLYHTRFVKALMEGNAVTGAVIHSKSGLQAVHARVIVDCSGDADVAADAGAAFELGRHGTMQPATMFFRIGNVDSAKLEAEIRANLHAFHRENGVNYRSFHWRVAEARAAGDWNLERVSIGMFRGVKPDEWSINTSRIMGVDGTDAESLTEAEMEGRRQAAEIFSFIRKYLPGCGNAVLLSTASTVGIRETRHVRGDHVLTVDDVLDGRVAEDSILLAANSVDVHGRFGPLSNEYLTIRDGEWYGVPYRCLLPLGIENLLVAGRSVSAESDAAGAVRVMPPCMGMGQAAGTAAAMAVRQGLLPRRLDAAALRTALRENRVFLG